MRMKDGLLRLGVEHVSVVVVVAFALIDAVGPTMYDGRWYHVPVRHAVVRKAERRKW